LVVAQADDELLAGADVGDILREEVGAHYPAPG
jgi:hypothetical protein